MVDIKKLQTFEQLVPKPPAKVNQPDLGAGPTFKETLGGIEGVKPEGLEQVSAKAPLQAKEGVKFSNHAIERMRTRGISYSPDDVSRISNAISRAAAKGSKDSLILMDDSALIVSVKNNTVVTVMDKNTLKENVFTNIDSTVVI